MRIAISFFTCLFISAICHGQLVVNEFSQGNFGNREYIEFVVVGTKTCTDSTADLRNWIFDDQNGWFDTIAIGRGHFRFANISNWQKVPYGSIILIYNNQDKNTSITLPDDPTDANKDYTYIVPVNSSLFIEYHSSLPVSPSSATFTYPTTGYITPTATAWQSQALTLNNNGDAIILVKPNNLSEPYFSLLYSITPRAGLGFRSPTIYLSNVSASQNAFLSDSLFATSSSWLTGTVPTNETPGAPNGGANSAWINRMRINTKALFSVNDSLQCLSGNSFVFTNNSTIGACIPEPVASTWTLLTPPTPNPFSSVTGTGSSKVTAGDIVIGAGFNNIQYNGTQGLRVRSIANPWPTTPTPDYHLDFPFSPNIGFGLTISSYSFTLFASGGTASVNSNVRLAYIVNGGTPVFFGPISSVPGNSTNVNVSINSFLPFSVSSGQSLAIRIYVYGDAALSSSRNFYIKNVAFGGEVSTPISPQYFWNFGDGTSSTATNPPAHTYTSAGTYPVKLIATNSCNCTDSVTKSVTVLPAPVLKSDSTYACNSIIYKGIKYTSDTIVKDSLKTVSTPFCDSIITSHYFFIKTLTPPTIRDTVYGCGMVVYGGVTYTSSTILIDILKSAAPFSCDSVYRFHHINVQNITPTTVRDTVNGCGMVVYGGNTYTSSTILRDTLKSAAPFNCDSVYRYHHIIVQTLTPPTVRDTVYGCGMVVYGGVTYNSSTILRDTLRSAMPFGCDSVYRFHHINVQNITPTIVRDTVYGCGMVVYGGVKFTSSTILNDTLKSVAPNYCDSVYRYIHINILNVTPFTVRNYVYGCSSVVYNSVTYTSSTILRDTIRSAAPYNCDIVYQFYYINVQKISPVTVRDTVYGCKSVVYGGNTYTSSSILKDTLKSAAPFNCDSVYRFHHINVQTLTPPTIRDTVYGCGSVVYGGNTYTSSTILKDTLKSAAPFSCDSVYRFHHINVQTLTPPTVRDTVYGCGSVVYGGNTYTSSTILNDTLKSAAPFSCDSVYRFHHINVQTLTPPTVRDTVFGCGSVVYGGNTYTSSTILNDTLKSAAPFNCDSVYRFHHINVQTLTPPTIRDTVYGCGSVVYGGNTYTSSTILKDTLKSAAPFSCDSVYRFHHIDVQTLTPPTVRDTVFGCGSVTYGGVTYTSSTVLNDTLKSAAPYNCDSLYRYHHIVVQNITPTVQNDTLRGCTSVVFNSVTYTSSTVIKDTVRSSLNCDSIYRNTHIIIAIAPVNMKDTLAGCISITFLGVTYTSSASVKDTLKTKFGCDSVYRTTQINIGLSPATQTKNLYGCNSLVYQGMTYTVNATVKDTLQGVQGCDSIYINTDIFIKNLTPATVRDTVYGCSPVVYGGSTYTSSVILKDTLKSTIPFGCDSVFRFHHINVQNLTSKTVRDTVYGCGTVVYDGVTYNSSTVYKDTLKSAAPYKCDSVYRFHHINVQNITPSTARDTVYGCGSVMYGGVTYNSSVTLKDTLKSTAPYKCDSVYRFHHIVVQNIAPLIQNDTLRGCTSVVFNGKTYSSTVVVNDTVRSSINCDSIYKNTHIFIATAPVIKNDTISHCSSITFLGVTYTSSASVNDTLKTTNGCDSVYRRTHININALPTTQTYNLFGCNSLVYQGNTYTVNTILKDTLQSANGCDSIYFNTNIFIQNISPKTVRDTVYGCGSVVYSGVTYNSSITLKDTLKSAAPYNCDSVYRFHHIVVQNIISVVQNDTLRGCMSVVFNGITYTIPVVIKDTVRSSLNCDSIYKNTQIFIASAPVNIYDTITGCYSVTLHGVTYTSSASVKDTSRSIYGCDSMYRTTQINIGAPPTTQTKNLYGCNSLIYQGMTYTVNTTLTDTLQGLQGCDSINIKTNIFIKNLTPTTIRDTVHGCGFVVYGGVTHTLSTVLKDTLKSVAPYICDSVYRFHYIVVQNITPVVQNDTLRGCTSVVFNGNTYSSPVVIKDTVRSLLNCDSIFRNTHIIITAIQVNKSDTIFGCSSVIFLGVTYTSSASVKDTLKTTYGCDSVYRTTQINIGAPPISQTKNLYGCNSLVYQGMTFTVNTTFTDTLQGVQGCDSIIIKTNIFIKNLTPIIFRDTVYGCRLVVYGGVTYASSTVLNDTLTSVAPYICDSVYLFHHIVVQNITPLVQNDTLRGCTSVVFNGNIYSSPVIIKDTVRSLLNCDSIYKNTHIIIASSQVNKSDTITGCSNVIFLGVTYTSSASVKDTLKTTYGCDSVYRTTQINIGAPPTTQTKNLYGCNSLVYQGITYTINTTFTDTLIGVQGCDSINIKTYIFIKDLTPATVRDTVYGCKLVVYGGITYTSSTVLNDTLKGAAPFSCDSIYIFHHINVQAITPTTVRDTLFGCSSLVYNGNKYTSSTVLNDTLKSALPYNCDSIYRFHHINVQNITPFTIRDTVYGCWSLLYGGVKYTASTVLNDTLKSAAPYKCDSVYRFHYINVQNITPFTVRDTVYGCGLVVYNSVTYSSSTVLRDTIKSASPYNCDIVYRFHHIFVQNIIPGVQNDTLRGCTSVVFNGKTYSSPVVIKDTVRSSLKCDSIYKNMHIIIAAARVNKNDTITGCTSVTFLGVTFTSSASVKDTLKTIYGCDSVYRTTQIYIGVLPSTQTNKLYGCNSLIFQGMTFTVNATLKDTLQGVQGCDSIYINTNIFIQNMTPTTVRDTVYGCGTVVYSGVTYNSSTILSDTLKSTAPFSCDSVYRYHHIVVQNITPTVQNDTLRGCTSVVFNSITYTSSVVIKDTVRSSLNCDSIYKNTNIIIAATPVNKNDTITGCSSVTFLSVTYTSSTSVKDTLETIYGCDSVFRITQINIGTPPNTQTNNLYGCNSLVYQSITYTANTIRKDTLQGVQGCDSIYINTNIFIKNITPPTVLDTVYGCGMVVFVGVTYTTSTILRDTLKSAAPFSCDSVYRFHHIVVQNITPVVQNNTLRGCTSVLFNGTTYTTSTIVRDTLTSVQGCDSLFIVTNIKVGEPAIVRNNTLSGCTSVLFNGVTYTTSTIFRDTLTSAQGCDSLYIVTNIKVGEPAIVRNDTLTGCTSVLFNGTTYTTSTIVRDTLTSVQGCDSLYIVTNIKVGEPAIVRNDNLRGCTSVLFNGVTYTASTIVRDTITSVQGCDSLYRITQINIQNINPVTQSTSLFGCSSVTYLGNTYTTSTLLKDTLKTQVGCDSVYQNTQITVYNIAPITQVTTISGCNSVVYLGVTYNVSTAINDTIRTINNCDSIYKVTNINIKIITPANQNYSLQGCGSVAFNGATYLTSTIVKDTLLSIYGCDSLYRNTNIIVSHITPTTLPSTLKDCKVVVYKGKSYTASAIVRDTVRSVLGCDSIFNVVQISIPMAAAVQNISLAGCDTVIYNGNKYGVSTIVKDTLRSVAGCDSVIRTATITISPFKIKLTGTPNPANHGSIVNFEVTSTSTFNVLVWLPLSAFPVQSTTRNNLLADSNLNILVVGQSALGCFDTARLLLQINAAKDFFIPNAFSPNNDNNNDVFKVYGTSIVEVNIKIFNQYGEMVFEANDNKGWDGMWKGKQQPVGVYSYLITTRLVGSQPFMKKGMFNLIR